MLLPRTDLFSVAGVFPGFPALAYCLKREGFYSDVCDNSTYLSGNQTAVQPCVERDARISNIFNIGAFLSFFSILPFATILYKFELFTARIISSTVASG